MIDFKTLTFGDSIFIAKEKNHVFSQQRIKMIDADGIEWHRYDRDRFSYEIVKITYCGKVTFVQEGEVRLDEDRAATQYHFKYPDGQIYYEYDNEYDFDLKDWFHTREEAETRIADLKAMRNT
jgi:hypothetical protein